jgi:hypothetical protein
VTGTDAGVVAEVKVFDPVTHALIADFLPFGPGFRGGARVAVGDVNGDGTPDIVVGAGPGGGPQVNVYDGKTFQLIGTVFAFVPVSGYGFGNGVIVNITSVASASLFAFTGGVYVAVGDVNGDGFADIIVGAGTGGGPQVQVFSGKDGSLLDNFYAFGGPNFTGGIRVAAGDLTGAGHADIICAAGPGGSPQVTVYDGPTLNVLANFFAFNLPRFTGGLYVATGDLKGTGMADIIVSSGAAGPEVAIYGGPSQSLLSAFYAYPPSFTGGVRVATDDVNGTGKADILAGPGPLAPPLVQIFSSQTLSLASLFYAYPATYGGGFFIA